MPIEWTTRYDHSANWRDLPYDQRMRVMARFARLWML